jgi:tetratricopeptide (TPR) repeat protein
MNPPTAFGPLGHLVLSGAWLALGLMACAPARGPIAPPSPAEIPALEERTRLVPGDAPAQLRLGVAYLDAGRAEDARAALEAAASRAPDNAVVRFYLGLAYEETGQWDEARQAMEAVVASASAQALTGPAERRLPLLRRRALEAEIRGTLEDEAVLAGRPPMGGSVAVYPFRYTGADPELAPLGTALAEMVVSDLSQVDRVTVLERLRVRLLLDEMRMSEDGYVDPATAVRSGRLLGAERVVQGNVGGEEARIEILAGLVRVGAAEDPASLTDADALENFFDLQKRLVLGLFESMGVQLTPAERERVMERPTQNLRALILFGRALEAEDRGAWATAAGLYQQAAQEDPDFEAAQEGEVRTTRIAHASTETPQRLAQIAQPQLPPPSAAPASQVNFGALAGMIPSIGGRDPAAEFLGQEGLGSPPSIIEIILRPPGGQD